MNTINTGYSLYDNEARSVTQVTQAQQAYGNKEVNPQRQGNETSQSVSGIEHTETDQSTTIFSHNRYQALSAYKTYGQQESAQTSEETEEAQPELPSETAAATETPVTSKTSETSDQQDEEETDASGLTEEEQEEVQDLEDRDQEVRTHEQAHMSAAGGYGSGPYYSYESGPDGGRYATEGHVNIDTSKEDTPEKTIQKMDKVIAAANAPAEPSSQDRKVASQAQQTKTEAQAEKLQEEDEESEDTQGATGTSGTQGAADSSSSGPASLDVAEDKD